MTNPTPGPNQPIATRFEDAVAFVALDRPARRNAMSDEIIYALDEFFGDLPTHVKSVLLHATGDNFSSGLDLNELSDRAMMERIAHSQRWHRMLERIEFGRVPVVAVLKGAVIGGGLELAAACHIRVAEESTFYALPEASRGIFVGGGGSVRIPRLIGESRMMEMMMTGRVHNAAWGERMGLSHYLAAPGEGLELGTQLARRVAENTEVTNFALIHALPRIARDGNDTGYLLESLMSAISSGDPGAQDRIRAFLEKRGAKVAAGTG